MRKSHKPFRNERAAEMISMLQWKVKAKFGGRLRLTICGGASLSTEVEEFLRVTCCAFAVQGYAVYNELRLEEVLGMGHNPLGNPPCGEISLRGKSLFSGYYRNPELTRESMKDGWFHTGDIEEILPNGVVKIIDRKKNLIKHSQGEYIAVEYLENVYNNTPVVDDIWVYGDSFKSMLVAVVVLHEENTKGWAILNGFPLSALLFATENCIEHIKGVILESCPFDMERDLVTATLKKKRNKLVSHYQAEIDKLYRKLAEVRA
ncbi:PREDICTED: long chain acyl-CoA synthetase 1-like [Populus euphratica]|uniref:Long chain acyl-CoA synthetase 1-like n=1 Tax=Populus euphratica TaxID=75702 RepID=A0AAJ6V6Z4_POPEU|nr:PREDICTED: long chain acyl-CoA synthetase 1-like [Populus euphratica]